MNWEGLGKQLLSPFKLSPGNRGEARRVRRNPVERQPGGRPPGASEEQTPGAGVTTVANIAEDQEMVAESQL